jgi:hypothetical protein
MNVSDATEALNINGVPAAVAIQDPMHRIVGWLVRAAA